MSMYVVDGGEGDELLYLDQQTNFFLINIIEKKGNG